MAGRRGVGRVKSVQGPLKGTPGASNRVRLRHPFHQRSLPSLEVSQGETYISLGCMN